MSDSHPLSAGNVDGVIVLEVTQNLRSCSFEDEIYNCMGVSKFSKVRLLRFFYAKGHLSKELFEIVCSLRFVANF